MPLTDTAIINTKRGPKLVRKFDRDGLYIEVSPGGGKWWRFKYRYAGTEKRLSLGVYPGVNLKKARARTRDARELLADGVDPGQHRKATKATRENRAANSFEVVARAACYNTAHRGRFTEHIRNAGEVRQGRERVVQTLVGRSQGAGSTSPAATPITTTRSWGGASSLLSPRLSAPGGQKP